MPELHGSKENQIHQRLKLMPITDSATQPSACDLLHAAYLCSLRRQTERAIKYAEGAIEILLREAPIEIELKLEKRNEALAQTV